MAGRQCEASECQATATTAVHGERLCYRHAALANLTAGNVLLESERDRLWEYAVDSQQSLEVTETLMLAVEALECSERLTNAQAKALIAILPDYEPIRARLEGGAR